MIYEISNNHINLKVESLGAEIQSFKCGGIEYVWQGLKYWHRHAPNLFPYAGRMKDNTLLFNGKKYLADRHGFARNMQFSLKNNTADSLTLALKNDETTEKLYPFQFILEITYSLSGSSLKYDIKVINIAKNDMYFSVGTHFAVNMYQFDGDELGNYTLTMADDSILDNIILDKAGFLSGEIKKYITDNGKINIDGKILEDTLIFKNYKSKKIALKNIKTGKSVVFCIDNSYPLAFWSTGDNVEFICIEPWAGLPDSNGELSDFKQKVGIICLKGKEVFNFNQTIQII